MASECKMPLTVAETDVFSVFVVETGKGTPVESSNNESSRKTKKSSTKAEKKEKVNKRRILCYGDSLTAGFHSHGFNFHPYASKLAQLIHLHIDHIGMNGWTVQEMVSSADKPKVTCVCGRVWEGLEYKLREASTSQPYDLVIIMAGTNDLSAVRGSTAEQDKLLDSLKALHSIAHKYHCETICLSIPEMQAETGKHYENIREARTYLNAGLRKFASAHSRPTKDSGTPAPRAVTFVDGCRLLPSWHTADKTTLDTMWDDGLHLTPAGI